VACASGARAGYRRPDSTRHAGRTRWRGGMANTRRVTKRGHPSNRKLRCRWPAESAMRGRGRARRDGHWIQMRGLCAQGDFDQRLALDLKTPFTRGANFWPTCRRMMWRSSVAPWCWCGASVWSWPIGAAVDGLGNLGPFPVSVQTEQLASPESVCLPLRSLAQPAPVNHFQHLERAGADRGHGHFALCPAGYLYLQDGE